MVINTELAKEYLKSQGKKEEANALFETIKKDYVTAVPYMELEKYLVQAE